MKSSLTPFSEFFKRAEELVSDDPSSYKDLDARALCTDPEDVLTIIQDPLIQGTWVDLGSGLGHTVITYAGKFPDRFAVGIEREASRVEASKTIAEALRLSCDFIQGDLLTARLPEGDTYFLYFPQGHVLDRILSELLRKEKFTLVAIESHGDLLPRLEKETWLRLEKEIPLKHERHYPCARIYRPEDGMRKLSGLHAYSFQEWFFLISDGNDEWWGDSLGLQASGKGYLLAHPPRTVREEEIVKTLTRNELPGILGFLVSLRHFADVMVSSGGKVYSGPIRKILGREVFSVEFPGGEKLQWKDIEWIKQGNQLCYDSSSQLFFLPPAP